MRVTPWWGLAWAAQWWSPSSCWYKMGCLPFLAPQMDHGFFTQHLWAYGREPEILLVSFLSGAWRRTNIEALTLQACTLGWGGLSRDPSSLAWGIQKKGRPRHALRCPRSCFLEGNQLHGIASLQRDRKWVWRWAWCHEGLLSKALSAQNVARWGKSWAVIELDGCTLPSSLSNFGDGNHHWDLRTQTGDEVIGLPIHW